MKNIAIIPARSGSKRIPHKNIKDFLGKPIISYAIDVAIKSNLFDTIMVSTDSEEIGDIAKKYCAEVPFYRSSINSSDNATTTDVILEVIDSYNKNNINFDYFCCIYPCTPMLLPDDIINSMRVLIENKCTTVFPITKYSHPIQRCISMKNNIPKRLYKEYENIRTQDLEPMFHDAGQYYCGNVKLFVSDENRSLLTNNTRCVVVDENKYQDIDNLEDWKLGEFKYEYNKRSL